MTRIIECLEKYWSALTVEIEGSTRYEDDHDNVFEEGKGFLNWAFGLIMLKDALDATESFQRDPGIASTIFHVRLEDYLAELCDWMRRTGDCSLCFPCLMVLHNCNQETCRLAIRALVQGIANPQKGNILTHAAVDKAFQELKRGEAGGGGVMGSSLTDFMERHLYDKPKEEREDDFSFPFFEDFGLTAGSIKKAIIFGKSLQGDCIQVPGCPCRSCMQKEGVEGGLGYSSAQQVLLAMETPRGRVATLRPYHNQALLGSMLVGLPGVSSGTKLSERREGPVRITWEKLKSEFKITKILGGQPGYWHDFEVEKVGEAHYTSSMPSSSSSFSSLPSPSNSSLPSPPSRSRSGTGAGAVSPTLSFRMRCVWSLSYSKNNSDSLRQWDSVHSLPAEKRLVLEGRGATVQGNSDQKDLNEEEEKKEKEIDREKDEGDGTRCLDISESRKKDGGKRKKKRSAEPPPRKFGEKAFRSKSGSNVRDCLAIGSSAPVTLSSSSLGSKSATDRSKSPIQGPAQRDGQSTSPIVSLPSPPTPTSPHSPHSPATSPSPRTSGGALGLLKAVQGAKPKTNKRSSLHEGKKVKEGRSMSLSSLSAPGDALDALVKAPKLLYNMSVAKFKKAKFDSLRGDIRLQMQFRKFLEAESPGHVSLWDCWMDVITFRV